MAGGALAAGCLALVAAGCGSSSHSGAGPSGTGGGGSGGAATYTISASPVGSLGTVLVNGQRRTLYLLSSEKGGKITCTGSNGCTAVWPPVELPSGVNAAIAGNGVDASRLGAATSSSGGRYVTYDGWPLYEYSGDHAGSTNGVGITSFGGTWYAVTTSGNPAGGPSPSTSTSTGGNGSGGYGGGGY